MPVALIVEDEPEANQLLSMLVRLKGYQTQSAFTGNEALAEIERSRPDVVFLDLMLPDINGFDVCRAIKSSRPTCAIPVVMVTARLAAENRAQGFRAGITDYVPKPYTPDQIFRAMTLADRWREQVDQARAEEHDEGALAISSRDDPATLREFSRLMSTLLAVAPVPGEEARSIDEAASALFARAAEWVGRHPEASPMLLDLRWNPDGFQLGFRDAAGWLAEDRPDSQGGLGGLIGSGPFDEIDADAEAGNLVFTRRFARERSGS